MWREGSWHWSTGGRGGRGPAVQLCCPEGGQSWNRRSQTSLNEYRPGSSTVCLPVILFVQIAKPEKEKKKNILTCLNEDSVFYKSMLLECILLINTLRYCVTSNKTINKTKTQLRYKKKLLGEFNLVLVQCYRGLIYRQITYPKRNT